MAPDFPLSPRARMHQGQQDQVTSIPILSNMQDTSTATTTADNDKKNLSVYHDYALEGESESLSMLSKEKNGSESNFPVKLHYMLSDMEGDGLDHIVSWQPHGRSFTVNKPKEFVEKILPLWFRQTKLSSFQRQLNLYGFKRITQGRDKGAHYHELFLRGKRHLAHRIPRMKIKGRGPRESARPAEEPNFYTMPYLPPHEKVDKKQQQQSQAAAVYRMQHMPSTSVHEHTINAVLEQALAHRAYLNYTSQQQQQQQQQQHMATRAGVVTFAPLPSPPPLPSPHAVGLSSLPRGFGGGFAAPTTSSTTAGWTTEDTQVLAALREKEMLTVALLQRLRSRP